MATLLCLSVPLFQTTQTQNARYRLTQELTEVLQFARLQAFLRGETLVLAPLDKSKNWSQGLHLFVQKSKEDLQEWHWKHNGIQLSWHGFQSNDYLMIDSDLSRLALNGYFLIEDGSLPPEKIILNRLGKRSNKIKNAA